MGIFAQMLIFASVVERGSIIAGGRKAGLSQEEIAEVIRQMSLYGGFPSAINAALEVFEADDDKA